MFSLLMAGAALLGQPGGEVQFEKVKIADERFEACSIVDVNGDGARDLVSGDYWYEGPAFAVRHRMAELPPVNGYFNDFANFPMDVNGDGRVDIVTGGFFNQTLQWRENPGAKGGLWPVHDIAKIGSIERPCFWDIDGDGHMDAVPNTLGFPQQIFKLIRDENGNGTGKFIQHRISDRPTGHGLGFGDLSGDGKGDLIVSDGWFEQPEKPFEDEWPFHPEFNLDKQLSVPILAHDVNGDGRLDLIAGMGHAYGLAWWEQGGGDGSARTWTRHDIDPERSQYHEAQLADIDNDGELELVTGKRYHAHSGNDPGAEEPVGLYYFEINGGAFDRVTIDYGPAESASGTGLYIWIADVTGNGWKDILAPGKEGLYLFKNLGTAK